MEALFLLIGLIVGGGVIGFLLRSSLQRLGREREVLRGENETQTQQLIALHREAAEQTARAEALEHRLEAQQQTQQQQELQRQQQEQQRNEQQKLLFRNLANEILEEKSRQFHQSSEASMESFLKPFRENVDRFRKQVEELYDKETQQRISLKEELRRLNETNLRMSEEATQLTRALKGDSKVQGDWGEMILETILGQSHLVKGVHYLTQENLKDETGNNLRPDVILNLPDRKQIIIDSKVSLTAYVAYAESTTPEASARALKEHLRSVRSHIEELGSKRYQTLVDSPDFVILFMPNEPAFLLAMQHEPTLWSDAYNKKVIVSSPTNLFALLKLVDDLWKRESQSKNALAIASEGAKLYDKFMGFTETFTRLGRSLTGAHESYDQAMRQLKTGSGNLVHRAEILRKLGVKATKQMPQSISDYEEDSEELPSELPDTTPEQETT